MNSSSVDLTRFALTVLRAWHNNGQCGDVDGLFLQDQAVACGLIAFGNYDDDASDYTIAPRVLRAMKKLKEPE